MKIRDVYLWCIGSCLLVQSLGADNTKPTKLFAKGVVETYANGESLILDDVVSRMQKIYVHRPLINDVMEQDIRSQPADLGYHSTEVEKNVIIKENIDLTKVRRPQYLAVLVDDEVTITVEGTTKPYKKTKVVKGSALWRPQSRPLFGPIFGERDVFEIPPGDVYEVTAKYTNRANLTDRYEGRQDVDGLGVFVYEHIPAFPVVVTEVPKYVFADAKHATPVTFTFARDVGDNGNVEIESIEAELMISDQTLHKVDLGQRFVAVVNGEASRTRRNGESDTYTCFIKSSDIKKVVVPNNAFVSQNFSVQLNVKWKAEIKGEVKQFSSRSHGRGNYGNKVEYFADKNVFAMDIPGEATYGIGNSMVSINAREVGMGAGPYKQDVVDRKPVSAIQHLAGNGNIYGNYPDDPQKAYPHDQTLAYGFTAKRQHVLNGNKITHHCELKQGRKLTAVDNYNGSIYKSYAYGARRGGYLNISYPGKMYSVLVDGEYAMDLSKDKGTFDWELFGTVNLKITNEQSVNGTLTTVASGTMGIVSGLAGGPWATAWGTASTLYAIYVTLDSDKPADKGKAHSMILEVTKMDDETSGTNAAQAARIRTVASHFNKGAVQSITSYVKKGQVCRVGEQWTYFAEFNGAVVAEQVNSPQEVSAIIDFTVSSKADMEKMKINLKN